MPISSPTPDATTTNKGKIMLAGDLAGTAASPTVPKLAWCRVARVTATGARTTTSTSYVDIPTDTVVLSSLVKKRADSLLVISVEGSFFLTGTIARVTYGVNFNGTDTDIATRFKNELSSHAAYAGTREFSGVAAGTYTFTLRVKTSAGTWNIATGDNTNSLSVMEIMPS